MMCGYTDVRICGCVDVWMYGCVDVRIPSWVGTSCADVFRRNILFHFNLLSLIFFTLHNPRHLQFLPRHCPNIWDLELHRRFFDNNNAFF